jgi:hypothetical protein
MIGRQWCAVLGWQLAGRMGGRHLFEEFLTFWSKANLSLRPGLLIIVYSSELIKAVLMCIACGYVYGRTKCTCVLAS